MSRRMSRSITARSLSDDLAQHGAIVVRGMSNLAMLKRALDDLVATAGFRLTFDPASAPDLRDYLLVGARSALDGAAAGSVVGFLIGLLFGNPRSFAGFGMIVGAGFGAYEGGCKVELGWRIRAVWDDNGQPVVLVSAE